MRICIPAADTQGLQSALESHFPNAVAYQVFDTDSKAHVEIRLGDEAAANQDIGPIDAVICGSINRRALRQLQQNGIQVMGTNAQTVAEALAQFERGELQASEPVTSCGAGHNHEAEHQCCGGGHGHQHGSGEDHECCGAHQHQDATDHECCGGGHGHGEGCCGGEHYHGNNHSEGAGCGCKN